MGDHSLEPVDETMSGNKYHCKNKKYILFVLFSYVLDGCTIACNITCHLIIIILLHVLLLLFLYHQ